MTFGTCVLHPVGRDVSVAGGEESRRAREGYTKEEQVRFLIVTDTTKQIGEMVIWRSLF